MCFLFRPPFYKFPDVVYLITLKVLYIMKYPDHLDHKLLVSCRSTIMTSPLLKIKSLNFTVDAIKSFMKVSPYEIKCLWVGYLFSFWTSQDIKSFKITGKYHGNHIMGKYTGYHIKGKCLYLSWSGKHLGHLKSTLQIKNFNNPSTSGKSNLAIHSSVIIIRHCHLQHQISLTPVF